MTFTEKGNSVGPKKTFSMTNVVLCNLERLGKGKSMKWQSAAVTKLFRAM